MKKLTALGLIALLLGAVFVTVAFASVGFDIERLGTQVENEQKTFTANAAQYKRIVVEDNSNSIIVKKTSEKQITVTYYESERLRYDVVEENDALIVRRRRQISFFSFDFSFKDRPVELLLPEDYDGALELINVSGRIDVEETLAALSASSTSGEIIVAGSSSSGAFEARSVSGAIKLGKIESASLRAETTSGKIAIDRAVCGGAMNLKSVSGGISVQEVKSQTLDARTTSGGIEIQNAETEADIALGSVSGRVQIKTLVDYRVEAHSVSGRITIPNNNAAAPRKITASTTSGSIEIETKH